MVLTLQAEGLGFAFRGAPALLADVSFTLRAGRTLCLLGPNGCGKTTLLRCLLGLETPRTGRVLLDGADLAGLDAARRARRMAYVPQNGTPAFPFSAFDVVLMGRSVHLRFAADPDAQDRRIAAQALERLHIGHLEQRPYHELSGGERQLVLLARALAQEAPLLVLDEPCAGLDLGHQVLVLRALRSLAADGYAVLMSTHQPEHACALGADVALLLGGHLRGPAPAARLLDAAELSRLYGTPVDLVTVGHGPAAGQQVCVPVIEPSHQGREHDATTPPAGHAADGNGRFAEGG